jgi:outer membrane receptor protein involved in Fe transport
LPLERIDVLTAGSSAVYGSDATAGVINLILKRGFDGAMTQITGTSAPGVGFWSGSIAQLYGKSWESGNFTGSLTISDAQALHAEERSYYTNDFTPWGLMDFTPIGSSIPAIAHAGNATTPAGTPGGNGCQRNPILRQLLPRSAHQNGGLTWAGYRPTRALNDAIRGGTATRPHLPERFSYGRFGSEVTENLFGFGPVSLFADSFYYNFRGKQVYRRETVRRARAKKICPCRPSIRISTGAHQQGSTVCARYRPSSPEARPPRIGILASISTDYPSIGTASSRTL